MTDIRALTQSYRPGPNDSEWPQPLGQSYVNCPLLLENAEVSVRRCFSCDHCAGVTLTLVNCRGHNAQQAEVDQ